MVEETGRRRPARDRTRAQAGVARADRAAPARAGGALWLRNRRRRSRNETDGALEVSDGTLYPVLYRLERGGYVRCAGKRPARRTRKYYRLTPAGEERTRASDARVDHVCERDGATAAAAAWRSRWQPLRTTSPQVTNRMPLNTPLRARIALELRATFAERVERASRSRRCSRNWARPMPSPSPIWPPSRSSRQHSGAAPAAKIIDFLLLVVIAGRWRPPPFFALSGVCVLGAAVPVRPYRVRFPAVRRCSANFTDQTVGKRLFGLRVVRESGARIGLGQAFVRQLPHSSRCSGST